jgi:protein ImuA
MRQGVAHAGRRLLLADLREQIERMESGSTRRRSALPFGHCDLDRQLPGKGLALGCLHEFAGASPAFEHAAAPISFVAGILARLKGPVLWCIAGRDLFAPGLASVGLSPERVIYAEGRKDADVLALFEVGLRSPGLAGVVGEVSRVSFNASRRLQLAAEASGVTAFLVRRWKAASIEALAKPTAAVTRWRISSLQSMELASPGIGRSRWRVDLLRCRGAEPFSWIVSACDEKGRLSLPADVADGPLQTPERRAVAG